MVFALAQAHDLVRERLAAAAAVGPDGGQHNADAQLPAQLRQQCDLAVGVGGEAVDGHDARQAERVADAAHVVQQVRHAAAQCVEIFRAEFVQCQTTVHFQRAHRRHHDGGVRPQPGEPALDVQKLLRAEVGAKAGLRHGVVAAVHGHARGEHTVAPVRDVGKRPAVHERRRALERLHEVGLERVAQQRRHRAHGLEIARCDGAAVIRVAHEDAAQPRLQIGHGLGQAEHRHDLAGDRDVESVLARHAVGPAAEPVDDAAQLPVVHVHAAPPRDAPRVDAEGVALLDVVVEHGGEQVVRRADGVKVAGEVQVDVLHRHDLRVAAAGRAALAPEHRAERRLAQRDGRVLPDAAQRVGQTDRRGRLALAGGRGCDGRDKDQLALSARRLPEYGQRHLCLIAAIRFYISIVDADGACNVTDRLHRAALGDLQIASIFHETPPSDACTFYHT